MCFRCSADLDDTAARRAHVLRLLVLVEHPDALPPEAALRLGQEVMALIGDEPTSLRCDSPNLPASDLTSAR
jgi:hypothetical protein